MAVLALPGANPVASAITIDADPNGLAIANGVLYVADGESGTVMRADSTPLAVIASGGIEIGNRIGGAGRRARRCAVRDAARPRLGRRDLSHQPRRFDDRARLARGAVAARHRVPRPRRLLDAVLQERRRPVKRLGHPHRRRPDLDDRTRLLQAGRPRVGRRFAARHRRETTRRVRGRRPALRARARGTGCAARFDLRARPRLTALVTTYDAELKRGAVLRVWLDGRSREVARHVGAARHRDRWRARVRLGAPRRIVLVITL